MRCNAFLTQLTGVATGTDSRELLHSLQQCSAAPARKLRRNHTQLKVQGRQMLRCVIAKTLGWGKKETVQLEALCGLSDLAGLGPHFYICMRKIRTELHTELQRRKNLACSAACSLS